MLHISSHRVGACTREWKPTTRRAQDNMWHAWLTEPDNEPPCSSPSDTVVAASYTIRARALWNRRFCSRGIQWKCEL